MTTTIEFRTPEETALQLELLLLGTLTSREFPAGPIAAMPVSDVRLLREIRRMADRIQTLSSQGGGGIGVIGAVPASRRALASTWIAASLAAKRTVTLVDADLRSAHLSFDEGVYAQEGLVDVLRYGVRSPRVVAPTQVPGVSLLPVGSGTVDLAGTWASGAVEPLLGELARSGDFLVINGPGLVDLEDAAPFLDRISSWMLIHEIGTSDPEETLQIRDRIGADKIIGVLVLHPQGAISEPAEAKENLREVLKTRAEESVDVAPVSPSSRGRKRTGLFAVAGAAAVAAALLIPRLFSQQSIETRSNPPPVEEPWTAEETVTAPREEPSDGTVEPLTPAPILTPSSGGTSAPTTPSSNEKSAGAVPQTIRSNAASTGFDQSITATPPASPPAASPVSKTGGAAAAPTTKGNPAPAAPAPSKPAKEEPSKPSSTTGSFGVHVCSMQTEGKAREEAKRFEASGYPAFIRRVDLGEKGIWHRVYAGPYDHRAAADRAAQEIRTRGLTDFTLVQKISGKSSSASGS